MVLIVRAAILALAGTVLHAGLVQGLFGRHETCIDACRTEECAKAFDKIETKLKTWEQIDKISKMFDDEPATGSRLCFERALQQLSELKNAAGPKKCTSHSVKILNDNVLATRNQARLAQPTRSIDKLVKHHLKTHAEDCIYIYVSKMNSTFNIARKDLLGLVQDYGDRVIDKVWIELAEPRQDLALSQFKPSKLPTLALDYLKSVAKEQERAALYPTTQMSRDKRDSLIDLMIKSYMVEPCYDYFGSMNKNILDRYDFDLKEVNNPPSYTDTEFSKALAHGRICKALLDEGWASLRRALIRVIEPQ